MIKTKHSNIPIFLPELSCPHQCIFCNQSKISGKVIIPSPTDIGKIIDEHLDTMNDGREVEIAFFGGSFTGLDLKSQESYLAAAYSYIKEKKVNSIRLSTRPDYINKEIIELLKKYEVTTIELGVQSTDDEVLKKSGRGHNYEDIRLASELILDNKISLGLQMMIGLPGDTLEKSIKTANDIVKLGASSTRIYPTMVIKDTVLEKLYNNRSYEPLSLSESVKWTKEIIKIFIRNNVKILRVGLHPSKELKENCSLVAGPTHYSFKELVITELFYESIFNSDKLSTSSVNIISSNSRFINYAYGYNSRIKNALAKNNFRYEFKINNELSDYEINVSSN